MILVTDLRHEFLICVSAATLKSESSNQEEIQHTLAYHDKQASFYNAVNLIYRQTSKRGTLHFAKRED